MKQLNERIMLVSDEHSNGLHSNSVGEIYKHALARELAEKGMKQQRGLKRIHLTGAVRNFPFNHRQISSI